VCPFDAQGVPASAESIQPRHIGLRFAVADRSFTSFSQATLKAKSSRVYGGILWPYDNEDGLTGGTAVGHFVSATQLLPIPRTVLLPLARRGHPFLRATQTSQLGPM
jgi:hypothetical protein